MPGPDEFACARETGQAATDNDDVYSTSPRPRVPTKRGCRASSRERPTAHAEDGRRPEQRATGDFADPG
jgi:hypothetical protein